MSVTYVHEMVHTGAETLSNQLNGTAVQRAGDSGWVRAAYVSSDGTSTATVRGKKTGRSVIPPGSHALQKTLADWGFNAGQDMIYEALLEPGEEIDAEVIAATASTSALIIRID